MRAALILLGVVFLATVLVRLPARALLWALPPGVACESPAGTIWSGTCGELRVGAVALQGLSWQLHPAALLHLRLAAHLASDDPAASGHAQVELARGGELSISALAAQIALPGHLGLVGPGTTGTLQLEIASARIAAGHLAALQGRSVLQQLRIANPPADLGSFELLFAPPVADAQLPGAAVAMLGQLRDLNGPLSVTGVLRLSPDGSYELAGSVAPKSDAGADLAQVLQLLGPPDAQGRRAFSIAGTM